MEFYPVEIREIFVNVSRKAEGFVEWFVRIGSPRFTGYTFDGSWNS
jgi:hypothetical protein